VNEYNADETDERGIAEIVRVIKACEMSTDGLGMYVRIACADGDRG